MVWDREIHGPALVDNQPVVGFSKDDAIKIRDALNEPALAGEVKSQELKLAAYMPTANPAPSHTRVKVRLRPAHEDQVQAADPPGFTQTAAEKFGIRPDCPACGMHMISVTDVSLVPGRRTYECLRCGHVSEPDGPESRPPSPWDE
jgi:predicted RNA-binding Zn-ribbon protein involved in translation (DUF1610 family)